MADLDALAAIGAILSGSPDRFAFADPGVAETLTEAIVVLDAARAASAATARKAQKRRCVGRPGLAAPPPTLVPAPASAADGDGVWAAADASTAAVAEWASRVAWILDEVTKDGAGLQLAPKKKAVVPASDDDSSDSGGDGGDDDDDSYSESSGDENAASLTAAQVAALRDFDPELDDAGADSDDEAAYTAGQKRPREGGGAADEEPEDEEEAAERRRMKRALNYDGFFSWGDFEGCVSRGGFSFARPLASTAVMINIYQLILRTKRAGAGIRFSAPARLFFLTMQIRFF